MYPDPGGRALFAMPVATKKRPPMEAEPGEGKAHEMKESPEEEVREGSESEEGEYPAKRGRKRTKAPMDSDCGCGGKKGATCDGNCGSKMKRSDALTAQEYITACELGIQGRSRSYIRARLDAANRLDKKCGSSGIPDNAKCSKGTTGSSKAKYEPTFGDRLNAGVNTAASIYTGGVGLLNLGMAVQHRSAGHAISGAGQLLGAGVGLKGASEYMKGRKLSGDLHTLGGAGLAMGGEAIGNAVAQSDFRRRQANAVANKSGYTGKDPFKDLGVPSDASAADIRRAYLKMAAKNHPDAGGNQAEFQRLKSAYDEILRRRGQGRGTRDSIWASGFAP